MSVLATPSKYNFTRFPLVEGEKAIKTLAHYLQVPYVLPKMDQIFVLKMGGGTNLMEKYPKILIEIQNANKY